MKPLIGYLAALSLVLSFPALSQDRPGLRLAVSERAYLASRVYSSLANFAHGQDMQQADVDAAYRRYLDRALATDDRFAFSRASAEFLATLHNGHTNFLDTALIVQGGTFPFAAAFIENKWVVTASATKELKPGDVIESIYAHLFPERFVLGLAGGRKVSIDRRAMPATPISPTEGRWLEPGKAVYIRVPS